jgi:uncharacterized membrane protein
MDKHRLELFSDGVFVIVLTLLVLDLKPPLHPESLVGYQEIAPSLLVHAMAFYVIGTLWLHHHNIFMQVSRIRNRTLLLNLLMLFWVTLMPFGARIAADHPLAPLGISFFTTLRALYFTTILGMRFTVPSDAANRSELMALSRRGRRQMLVTVIGLLTAAALSWASPWFGYASLLAPAIGMFVGNRRSEAEGLREPEPGPVSPNV